MGKNVKNVNLCIYIYIYVPVFGGENGCVLAKVCMQVVIVFGEVCSYRLVESCPKALAPIKEVKPHLPCKDVRVGLAIILGHALSFSFLLLPLLLLL